MANDSVEREVIYRIKIEGSEANTRTLRSAMKQLENATVGADKAADRSAKKREAAAKKASSAVIKEEKKIDAVKDKFRKQNAVADKKAEKDRLQRVKKAADDEIREGKRVANEKAAIRKEREREEIQADKERQQRVEKARRLNEQASANQAESTAKTRDAVNMGTDGVLKLGRGLALIGVISEESSTKMLQSLIKVQATFDILRGGIDTWNSLAAAARAYSHSLKAVEQTQAALDLVGAASGGVAGAAGKGAAGGAGAGAGLGLGSKIVGGTIKGATAAAPAVGIAALAAVAAASSALAINAIRERLTGRDLEVGSQGQFVAENILIPLGLKGGAMGSAGLRGAIDPTEALQRAHSERAFTAALERGDMTVRLGGKFGQQDLQRRLLDLQPQQTSDDRDIQIQLSRADIRERSQLLGSQRADLQRERGGIESHMDPNVALLKEQLNVLSVEELSLANERLEFERRIANERIQGAREAANVTKGEIAERKAAIEIEQAMMQSGRVRIGLTDAGTNASNVDLLRRARRTAGAGGQFGIDEIKRLQTLPGAEAARLAEQFAIQRAEQTPGVGEFFRDEQAAIRSARTEIDTLTVELNGQTTKVEVQIEGRDILLEEIRRGMLPLIQEIGDEAARNIKESTAEVFNAWRAESNQRGEQLDQIRNSE